MVRVIEDNFGSAGDPLNNGQQQTIKRFTLVNDMQMTVQVITYGATITSIQVPDAHGKVDDVTLGYDDIAGYQMKTNPYFGATVGRVCNRITNGRFCLDGREVQVSRNVNEKHQLHGGFIGFDKVHWQVLNANEDGVTMQHISPDGHEGYPGEVTATVRFTLTEDNCLHVRMEAETSATTPINMTNHSYFNLAGHGAGQEAIYAHAIQIKADKMTETDKDLIPTGKIINVADTPYDLRSMGNLGERLQGLLPTNGYDDNFCVELQNNAITNIAKAFHPPSGRWLEVASNQPGVQFYTGNFMPDGTKGEAPIAGKAGAKYAKQGAFCLETQKYPDAVNHPNFPSVILNPGEKYKHEVIYKFGISRNGDC